MDPRSSSSKRPRGDDGDAAAVENANNKPLPSSKKTTSINLSELKRRLAEDKARLMQTKASSPVLPTTILSTSIATPELVTSITAPTNAANQRYLKELQERQTKKKATISTSKPVVQEKVEPKPKALNNTLGRKKREIRFLEPGALTRRAIRQALVHQEQTSLESQIRKKTADEKPKKSHPKFRAVPGIEWWDKPFVEDLYIKNDAGTFTNENEAAISNTVNKVEPNENMDKDDNPNETVEVQNPIDNDSNIPKENTNMTNNDATMKSDSNANKSSGVINQSPTTSKPFFSISPGTIPSNIKESLITNVINHPRLFRPFVERRPPSPPVIMLTKEEQKKIRRQNSKRALEERREQELLGLREPQKSKIKISNMMKVLSESVTDPTKVMKMVRKEAREREERHFKRNQEGKLSKEERKEKKLQKLQMDAEAAICVAVFKIMSIHNSRNRFKIDVEAHKYLLTGCVVCGTQFVVLIVEGGPKAIKQYKKFLLRRIPWTEPLPNPKDDTHQDKKRILGAPIDPSENKCYLVWEGQVIKRTWHGFKFEPAPLGGRAFLDTLGLAHYWDSALNFIPPENFVNDDE